VSKPRGIYKRGGIYWLRTDPVAGRPISTKSKTLKGATEFLAEREQLANNPAYAASHAATLKDWVGKMLTEKGHTRSEGTLRFYGPKVGHLLRLFGEDASLSSITPGSVDAYLARRRDEGAHHYTISKEFTALRQVLKMAKRARAYSEDLTTLFPLGFGHGYEPREAILLPEHEATLRANLEAPRWACVAFILATSARLGELQRATKPDWDEARALFALHGTKTEKSRRVVPILSVTRGYLDEALPHLPFAWPKMTQQLPLLCERIGIPRVTPNDLRRTCATRLIEAGADPYLVAKITGHVDLKMLREVYDRSSPEKVRAAIEAQIASEGSKQ
jgi:integrase